MDADPDPADPGPGPGVEAAAAAAVVTGFDRTADGGTDVDRLVELAGATLAGEGVRTGRLDLVLVDADEMAELNAAHMGHAGPTDVLSFPLDADDVLATPTDPTSPGGGPPVHLGDVIVCPEVARDQAPSHCGTVDAELSLLVIHGVLHILGHDHAEPDEAAAMQARERDHLARLGFTHPGAQAASC